MDYVKLFSPLVVSYLVSSQCPVQKTAGINVVGRPPSYIFGIVWFILYLLIGYSWFNYQGKYVASIDIGFIVLIILLNSWIVIYSCYNKNSNSLYSILLSILVIGILIMVLYKESIISSLLLVPLIIWLIFALMLNFQELNLTTEHATD